MPKYSTGFVKDLMETNPVRSVIGSVDLNIYAGTVPDSPDDALPGDAVLLNTYNNGGTGGTWEATSSNGVLQKAAGETWSGTAAATGDAAYFRIVENGTDDGSGASTTAKRVQGTVGVSGADLNLPAVAMTSGNTYSLDYVAFNFIPQQS